MSTFHHGPRSAPASDLPIIRPGIDPVSMTCPRGHEGPHDAAPPLGPDRYGVLTCRHCGQTLAWVDAVPRRIEDGARPRGAPTMPTAGPIVLRNTALPPPDWRRPGCALACMRGRHSPEAHEAFGRQAALAEITARAERPSGVMRSGSLVVDFDAFTVTVDGARIAMTRNEKLILFDLAAHIGTLRTHEAIICAVWSAEQAELWSRKLSTHGAWHSLRVNILRLRQKLAAAADLIETVPQFGYLLRSESPVPTHGEDAAP